MTQNALQLTQTFFTQIFRIFTSIIVPGTNFSFAKLLFFIAFVPLMLKFFTSILGLGSGGGRTVSGVASSAGRALGSRSKNK